MTNQSPTPIPGPFDGRWPGDPRRVAILLPGSGYHPDLPLLYWAGRVVSAAGWTVQQVWWQRHGGPPGERSEWPAWVRAITAAVVEQDASAQHVLLIGKSLGSFGIPYAAVHGLAGIWLTPLISERHGPEVREALPRLPRSLVVGSTGDPSWDSLVAVASGHPVCEIDGANHSLEFDADPLRSIDAVRRVTRAVADYASGLESADRV